MDNDMALFADIAELPPRDARRRVALGVGDAEELRSQEDCAVTGGMFVFRPEKAEYDRAIAHLHGMYNGTTSRRFKYDGSDQEFFRSFYARRPHALDCPSGTATSYLDAGGLVAEGRRHARHLGLPQRRPPAHLHPGGSTTR